ncbi:MAG: nuclear transport factor 2 family protein [Propionibacteriales bacterium]|nr:nuclear transport factor 2 family protein [Propionibacteriales bacterium]
MEPHAKTVRRYWDAAEARDWLLFGSVLADDVVYELHQTRERIRGREAYLQFNTEYPGDWHVTIERIVADAAGASCWAMFAVGEESMAGISFFTFDSAGAIATIQDFWPESYDPPPGREHLTERF